MYMYLTEQFLTSCGIAFIIIVGHQTFTSQLTQMPPDYLPKLLLA